MKNQKNSVLSKIFFAILLFFIINSSLSFAQEKTLYERIGGYDAIAAVVDDFVMQLASDPEIGAFFKGHSTDSIKKIRMHVIDFICNTAGGPCSYTGRDMKTSHQGMGITEVQWNKSVEYLKNTLNKFKVPENEQNELFAAVSSVKKDIVEKM